MYTLMYTRLLLISVYNHHCAVLTELSIINNLLYSSNVKYSYVAICYLKQQHVIYNCNSAISFIILSLLVYYEEQCKAALMTTTSSTEHDWSRSKWTESHALTTSSYEATATNELEALFSSDVSQVVEDI